MQQPPLQNQPHLPYSRWAQHRADNGLIYLAHPATGEVKWLWSRHHDPKTEHDYLVNTITGQRQWVTKENEHFCPIRANPHSKTLSDSKPATSSLPANTHHQLTSDGQNRPSAGNSVVSMPTSPAKVALSVKQGTTGTKLKYREIEAPKSLGLTADEKLMLVPETGRRYIYNNKTKTSRWLPMNGIDTIASEKRTNSIFGRSRGSKAKPSDLSTDDDDDSEVKRKTQTPTSFTATETTPTPINFSGLSLNPTETRQGNRQAIPSVPNKSAQAFSHRNGLVNGRESTKGDDRGGGQNEENEVARRLAGLNSILADVTRMTTSEKYDMSKLRAVATGHSSKEQIQKGSQRLLELEEYLTQQMLKVDGVESEGNQTIRAKRKETVKAILALTEEIERLRRNLPS